MNAKNKIKFNPKNGMALPGVIVLLLILSVLGTAMYAYSMQSLNSVRFASNGKKAEYLARAGVEAVAYAYQSAMNNPNPEKQAMATSFMNKLQEHDGEGDSADPNIAKSSRVWFVYDKNKTITPAGDDDDEGTVVSGGAAALTGSQDRYAFIMMDDNDAVPSTETYDVIGYFEVTVSSVKKVDTLTEKFYNNEGKITSTKTRTVSAPVKYFVSTGYAGDFAEKDLDANGNPTETVSLTRNKAVYTQIAYLGDSKQGYYAYYGKNGIIDGKYVSTTTTNSAGQQVESVSTKNTTCTATEPFIKSGEYEISGEIQYKFRWLTFLNKYIDIHDDLKNEIVPIALSYSAGNIILDKPEETDTISFVKNQSNMVSLISFQNMFVRANVDATSSDGCFNSLLLKGDNIVIDGDIELSVYGFTHTGAMNLIKNIRILSSLLNHKYRYGTVVIDGLDADSTVENPYEDESPYTYNYGSGKVYFGGNVFVSIQLPNVGTYKYKAFSAGDVYYFNASNQKQYIINLGEQTTTTDENGNLVHNTDELGNDDGIDLLRYFLEYSIATNKYAPGVLQRFNDIIDFYYGNSGVAHASGNQGDGILIKNDKTAIGAYVCYKVKSINPNDTDYGIGTGQIDYNAMRKIDPNDDDHPLDKFTAIVPPDPSDGTGIRWGQIELDNTNS